MILTRHLSPFQPDIPVPTPIHTQEQTQEHTKGVSQKKTKTAVASTKAETKLIKSWFPSWFKVYPNDGNEPGALRSFPKAIRSIAKDRGVDIETACDWLIDKTREFATSERGRAGQYCPFSDKFLINREFDKPSLWNRSQNGNGQSSGTSIYPDFKPKAKAS